MTLPINTHARVPPGFRFHPTDDELINFYLKKKVSVEKFDLDHVIREVDLNKLEPWDLHERCKVDATHQTEWYFFSHKDKKYPTGTRTNRATAAGFWKATGRDKAVHSNCQRIGMRKTLVFYRGRAPHGQKTEWIMHEYRLEDGEFGSRSNEDGWVVCRVFKKRNQDKTHHTLSNLSEEEPPAPGPAPASKVEYSKKSQEHGVAAPGNTFACKQEVEEAPPQVAFLQLPQLESPKTVIANAGPCYNSADLKRIIVENYKKLEHPSPFLSEGPATINKSLCMAEDDLADYVDSGHITDWSLFESISRYHADLSNISVDIPQCLYSSKQQHLEYPSSYEVDLWNFTR